jgi:hypothetical protein
MYTERQTPLLAQAGANGDATVDAAVGDCTAQRSTASCWSQRGPPKCEAEVRRAA